MSKCLITGCTLVIKPDELWVHGDLHEIKGAYVFNAVLRDGETAWNYYDPPEDSKIIFAIMVYCFERRGIIVIPRLLCDFNAKAREHLHAAR